MLRADVAHRMRIRARRYLERQAGAPESRIHTRRHNVIERTEPESLLCVEQRKVLGMGVVRTQQNAHQTPPEKLVDVDFALLGLIGPHELRYLSIRTLIFRFGRLSEELIEFLEVDFLAAFRAIESPNEQTVSLDLFYRANFDFDDLIGRQKDPCRIRRQILQFDQMFQFRRGKLRDVRAWLAALRGTKLLALLHRKQLGLDTRNRGSIRERRNLFP